MKKVLVLLALFVSSVGFSQEDEISNLNWLTDFDTAKSISTKGINQFWFISQEVIGVHLVKCLKKIFLILKNSKSEPIKWYC